MFEEHNRLVPRVLVEPDFADPQHAGAVEELRDHRDHLTRQRDVLGLFGVDAQPGEMLNAKPPRPLRLERGELLEIVAKALDAPPVVPRPEGRLAYSDAAHFGQRLVVVRGPRDHVNMRIDVVHTSLSL